MVQQMRNQDFERPPNVDSSRGRKQKEQAEPEEQTGGFFHAGLTPELQQSLVNYSRRAVAGARVAGRLARRAHDDEKLARREDRLEKLLTAAVEHYARALELFDAWKAQRASSKQPGREGAAGRRAAAAGRARSGRRSLRRSSSSICGSRSRCAC